MRGSARIVLFVVVVLVGVSFWLVFRRGPHERSLAARELATKFLAVELVRRYPGSSALVISNPFAEKAGLRKTIIEVEEAGIRGLREGFGDQIKLAAVVYPPIRPEAVEDPRSVQIPQTKTPLSYLIAEDAFDRLAEGHPECELIVSLIGLPADLSKVALWSRTGPPHLALLLPDLQMVGGADKLRQAVETGKLAAMVLARAGAPPEHVPVGADEASEFGLRYHLVTESNVVEFLRESPGLLEAPRY